MSGQLFLITAARLTRYTQSWKIARVGSPPASGDSENIWLAEDCTVKLMDFGIARAHSSSHMTQTGMTLGTAYYMAPEERVAAKDVDWRADHEIIEDFSNSLETLYHFALGEIHLIKLPESVDGIILIYFIRDLSPLLIIMKICLRFFKVLLRDELLIIKLFLPPVLWSQYCQLVVDGGKLLALC